MNLCPSVEHLQYLLEGQLEATRQANLVDHIEACLSCQQQLEELTRGFSLLRQRCTPVSEPGSDELSLGGSGQQDDGPWS